MMNTADHCYVVCDDRKNKSMECWIAGHTSTGSGQDVFQLVPSLHLYEHLHHGLKIGLFDQILVDLSSGRRLMHFTNNTSVQIITGKSRRSDVAGPILQKVHHQMGIELSQRLLDQVGLKYGLVERVTREHVQAAKTFQSYVTSGKEVVILALMRGGEPMARGVFTTFPNASFIHYDDQTPLHKSLSNASHVIVVDSVINSGNSIRSILQKIPNSVFIFVLSGVTQVKTAETLPVEFPFVSFWSLRVSDNHYTGKGGTDTGNRLFGTH